MWKYLSALHYRNKSDHNMRANVFRTVSEFLRFVASVAQRGSTRRKVSKCVRIGMGRCAGFCQKGSPSRGSSAGISTESV